MCITAFHLFATFLWIAPSSSLREVLPGELLSKYMIPLWGQSWSVFAPEPINGDYYFDVRAVVATDDGEQITRWVRATDAELDHATYKPFPPRSAGLAVSVASDLKGAWDGLSDDQKAVVRLNYFKGDDSADRLKSKLSEDSDGGGSVPGYLKKERVATAYATQVAKAMWGEKVQRVQYQAARQNVVPFSERNDKSAERPKIRTVPIGWRALVTENHQSEEEFATYFCSSNEVRCAGEQ